MLPKGVVIGGVIALVVGVGLWARWEVKQENEQKVMTQTLGTVRDSVKSLTGQLQSESDELKLATKKVDTLWKIRTVYANLADKHGFNADSLIKLAVDTGTVCKPIRDAYNERTTQCDELKKALVTDSVSIRSADSTIRDVRQKLAISQTTVLTIDTNTKKIDKIAVCKIIFGVHCPSRKVSFLGGAATAIILTLVLK